MFEHTEEDTTLKNKRAEFGGNNNLRSLERLVLFALNETTKQSLQPAQLFEHERNIKSKKKPGCGR